MFWSSLNTILVKVLMLQLRDEFIAAAKKLGHEIDLINIYEEKQIKFWMEVHLINKF